MKKHVLVTLVAIALVAGVLLPILVNQFVTGPGRRERYIPVYIYRPREPGREPYTRERVFTGVQGLLVFEDYASLHAFLRVAAGFRALVNRQLPAPVILPVEVVREGPVPVSDVAGQPVQAEPAPVSKTNVQVEGVDEPDIVKTDGRLIVMASGSTVYIVSARERTVLSAVETGGRVLGLYLTGLLLTVLVESPVVMAIIPEVDCKCFHIPAGTPLTTIYVYSLENPGNPQLRASVSVTGSLVGSRLKDSTVYLVVNLPVGSGDEIPLVNNQPVPLGTLYGVDDKPDTYTTILALDIEKLEYAVYTFLTGGGTWLYMSHTKLYIAHDTRYTIMDAYEEALQALTKHLPSEVAQSVVRLVEEGRVVEALETVEKYLSTLNAEEVSRIVKAVSDELGKKTRTPETTFYVFNVRGVEVTPHGVFRVPGQLLDQFAMEEYLGRYFIVATTERYYMAVVEAVWLYSPIATWESTPRAGYVEKRSTRIVVCTGGACVTRSIEVPVPVEPGTPVQEEVGEHAIRLVVYPLVQPETSNSVFVVDLEELVTVGSLTGIAPGERVFAARLVKNIFFLVTAREIDPLFAIDVSNPEKPVVLGYLKIPGLSEYLHPLPGNRLLGVGVEGPFDLKISLFDVSDPANMNEVAKIVVSPGWSPALVTHHAVTVYLERNLVFIPYSYASYTPTSGVLVVRFDGNILSIEALLEHAWATRTVYIGNEVYTVSQYSIKVFNLNNYEEVAYIPLKP